MCSDPFITLCFDIVVYYVLYVPITITCPSLAVFVVVCVPLCFPSLVLVILHCDHVRRPFVALGFDIVVCVSITFITACAHSIRFYINRNVRRTLIVNEPLSFVTLGSGRRRKATRGRSQAQGRIRAPEGRHLEARSAR